MTCLRSWSTAFGMTKKHSPAATRVDLAICSIVFFLVDYATIDDKDGKFGGCISLEHFI